MLYGLITNSKHLQLHETATEIEQGYQLCVYYVYMNEIDLYKFNDTNHSQIYRKINTFYSF